MSIDIDGLTLDALHAFVVFAQHRNFTHAAEELNISQPALHVKIKKLAAALGVELYVKSGRRLELTTAGSSVAEFAGEVSSELDAFVAGLRASPEPSLVLAAGEGAHRYVLRTGLQHLVRRGRRLRLLTTNREETLDAVRSGRAHVGVSVFSAAPRGLDVLELATYPQVALFRAGHVLARRRVLALEDLADVDLVTAPPGRPQRDALERAAARAGVGLTIAAEAEGWSQMMDFVQLGVGVAIVNGCVLPEEGLVTRVIRDLPSVTYAAVSRTGERSAARIEELLAAIQGGAP